MSARLVFQLIETAGDMTVGTFDVELASGARVSLAGFRDGRGRIIVAGLAQILDRHAQNAAAGAVRAALQDYGHDQAHDAGERAA